MDSSTVQSDFGPSWSSQLPTTIPSNPELAIIESEAWKDQAHLRVNSAPTESTPNPHIDIPSKPGTAIIEHDVWTDHFHSRKYAPATPTLVDPLGWKQKAKHAECEKKYALLTPPKAPMRYERKYSSEEETDKETEVEDEEADEDLWFNAYSKEQWDLVKYGARHRLQEDIVLVIQGDNGRCIQELAKVIMFCVFLAVLLHGVYVHWNESQKLGERLCQCCQSLGHGSVTST